MLDSRYNLQQKKPMVRAQSMDSSASPQRVGMSKPSPMADAKPATAEVSRPAIAMQKKPMTAPTPDRKKMAMQGMISKYGKA